MSYSVMCLLALGLCALAALNVWYHRATSHLTAAERKALEDDTRDDMRPW